jgi:alpha-beta hydrolase superfamily lysophospholipase
MARLAESVVLLGPRRSLVGIHTPPAVPAAREPGTFVVILNAGIIHRVGPNRLHVELARAIAASGYSALRFDLSGIGDSRPRADTLPPLEAALADVREAVDSLSKERGATRFVLIGLCSGANLSIISASTDERIAAVGLIDPYIPRTRRYYFNHYFGRMGRVQSWRNFLRGEHPVWHWIKDRLASRRIDASGSTRASDPSEREIRSFLEGAYGSAAKRGVKIFAAFTADLEAQHNYREQIIEAFPEIPLASVLQLHYFTHADHTFSSSRDRWQLIEVLVKWLAQV